MAQQCISEINVISMTKFMMDDDSEQTYKICMTSIHWNGAHVSLSSGDVQKLNNFKDSAP